MLPTPGGPAPRQQSPVTCGAACLVVARMTLDADFAQSIVMPGQVGANARFAAAERTVMGRTNAWRIRGARAWTDLPWPVALGTSPWGALAELEAGTGLPYRLRWRRREAPAASLREAAARVTGTAPTLLYVGDRVLPRHVVLVATGSEGPFLYEPARGLVIDCGPDTVEGAGAASEETLRRAFAGWGTAWCSIERG